MNTQRTLRAAVPLLLTVLLVSSVSAAPNAGIQVNCANPFDGVIATSNALVEQAVADWDGESLGVSAEAYAALVDQTRLAGANYLNTCLDDPAALDDLAALEPLTTSLLPDQIITFADGQPVLMDRADIETIYFEVMPSVQRLDVNGDRAEDLILHTQLAYFDSAVFTLRGGLSIAYVQTTNGWQGYVIWPVSEYIASTEDEPDYPFFSDLSETFCEEYVAPLDLDSALVVMPAPQVERIALDAQDAYLAVSGVWPTPVADRDELDVLRWTETGPEVVLRVVLDDWCGGLTWEISEDGDVVLPPLPDTFPHGCLGPAPARTFELRNGAYTEVVQPES